MDVMGFKSQYTRERLSVRVRVLDDTKNALNVFLPNFVIKDVRERLDETIKVLQDILEKEK